MPKKIRVGLLFGGRSGEHEVSLASAMSVYNALDKGRYEITLIAIDKDGRWLLPDPKPLLAQANNPMAVKFNRQMGSYSLIPYQSEMQLVPIEDRQSSVPHVDVVLPILHGTYGEDGTVQGLLELAQIPYAGAGVLGSAIGMDKDVAGRLLSAAGIPTVPSLCVRKHEFQTSPKGVSERILARFSLPMFVKPANAGSSVGVHKVKSREDLGAAMEDALAFDTKVIVQKSIAARELEVSVLGNDQPRASVVGEIVPRHEFYSYEAKYLDENGAELHIPAKGLSKEIIARVQDLALKAFQILECRGMARVDFFMDRDTGDLYLNEINTIPGFTRISMYPKLWEASGLSYGALLDELIRLALEASEQRRALKTSYSKD